MAENEWESFVASCRSKKEQAQQQLREVEMLIKQTSTEVERLVQRNARAASRVRQVEAQLDTVPREDLKSAYNALLSNQQRLFTMRGQLEKLQSDKEHLTTLIELCEQIIGFAEGGGVPTVKSQKGQVARQPAEDLVIHVIEAQEAERLRLSRQMHDGPAQSLTNLVLQAEICEHLFDRDPKRAKAELAELKESVISTFHEVKSFIFDLRPMMLDDLGLAPTLKRYAEGLAENGFDGLEMTITGRDRRLAAYQEVTIFRVIQELIHIGRQYGHASSIKVNVEMEEQEIKVSVEDNGTGFELDEELSTPDAQQMGLPTLRKRIEMLGGTITFRSSPGNGMQVFFSLPVEEAEEE